MRSPVQTTQQPGPSELAEVKSNLSAAEEQNSKLTEQLTNANATVEQYRAVVLTLEDSLKNEKEVKLMPFLFAIMRARMHTPSHSAFS